jgi:prevent-host-death family protein
VEHTVGLRELRQNASELVRRAEAGERVTVTVAGRSAAVLGPAAERRWRTWAAVAEVFAQPVDDELGDDLRRVGDELADPWVND